MREIYIFGVRFLDATYDELFDELKKGGTMVAPSGPGLATINSDYQYKKSLISSKFAIFDSGILCICLLIMKQIKVRKMSGLSFIRNFFSNIQNIPNGSLFLIDPSESDAIANKNFLKKNKYELNDISQYIAPTYKDIEISDDALLKILLNLKPQYILINLGGGIQEKLAEYIQSNKENYRPSIICTGAAIAFLTGKQNNIPSILDKMYLGWLCRCAFNYKKFVPRYISALKFIPIIYREKKIEIEN